MTNPGQTASRRHRLRLVEELMLNGYSTGEIFDKVSEQFEISYGTIRNDVSKLYKTHREDIDKNTEIKGRAAYHARLMVLRRKAVTGWAEIDASGASRIKGRDLKLVHELDKELARFSGVELRRDTKNLAITVEKAKEYLDRVMGVVFKHVTDEEIKELIIIELALIDEQS